MPERWTLYAIIAAAIAFTAMVCHFCGMLE